MRVGRNLLEQVARRRRVSLHGGTARPLGRHEMGRKLDLRQAAGKQKPSVVGHDPHARPARAQERRNPVNKSIDLRIDLADEERVEVVAQSIELAGFGPATAFAANRHRRLVGVEDFDTGARHRIAQP